MRLLITGGTGFIGSSFIRNMIGASSHRPSCEILNLDKLTYAADPEALREVETSEKYQFIEGDICDATVVKRCLNEFKPDSIIHFAAESHVDNSIENAHDFIQTNIVGTYNLLNLSIKYWEEQSKPENFKFVHVSTDEVYGSLQMEDAAFDNQTPYAPNSPYSASKASSDHFVRAWHQTYKFPSIITHCSNNFGAWQNKEKLIPKVISNALSGKAIPIYGTGENIRDWIYVEDHVDGIITVLEKGNAGQTYNMGGDNEVSNIDLVKTICKTLDTLKPRNNNASYTDLIEFVTDRKGHDFRYAINNEEILKTLEWKPKTDFQEALENTIQWYLKELS